MHILPGAIIEAELEIPGVELILADVATLGKYWVAAIIGELKADNLPLTVVAILPPRVRVCLNRSFCQNRVVLDRRSYAFFVGGAENGFRQNSLWRRRCDRW